MPAKHPCEYYAKVSKQHENGCEIGKIVVINSMTGESDRSFLLENNIDLLFNNGAAQFTTFNWPSLCKFDFNVGGVHFYITLNNYCPTCGKSIKGAGGWGVSAILNKFAKYAADGCKFTCFSGTTPFRNER